MGSWGGIGARRVMGGGRGVYYSHLKVTRDPLKGYGSLQLGLQVKDFNVFDLRFGSGMPKSPWGQIIQRPPKNTAPKKAYELP